MPFPCVFRAATVLLVPVPAACSYDIAERPNGGPVAAAVDNTAPTASPLCDVRWELRELAGRAAPAMEQTPYLVLNESRTRVEGSADCNRFSGPGRVPSASRG